MCRVPLIFPITSPSWAHSIWRPGEEEFLESHPKDIFTSNVEEASVIWCRPVAELLSDSVRGEMCQFLSRHPSKVVLNHISSFLNHDAKEKTWELWRAHVISCPDFVCVNRRKDLQHIQQGRWLLRLNNSASSNWMFGVLGGVVPKGVWDLILMQRDKSMVSRAHTKIVASAFVGDWNGDHTHGVSYVVGSEVLATVAFGKRTINGRSVSGQFSDFIRQNELISTISRTPKFVSDVVKAVSVLGLDMGSVDFVLNEDNKVYFLEVNAFWGMGTSRFPYNHDWVSRLEKEHNLKSSMPDVSLLMDPSRFWGSFYASLARHVGCV